MSIVDLVNLAAVAELDAAAATARAARLKAAAVAACERARLTDPAYDRFTSDQGLGYLRLDGANKPAAARVVKSLEFGEWLAEYVPDQAVCTITVPARQLPEALQLLEFGGITDVAAMAEPAATAEAWLAASCAVTGDPGSVSGFVTLWVDGEGATMPVPGVVAGRPVPRWVLTAAPELKKARVAEGTAEAEEEAALVDGDPIAQVAQAKPVEAAPAAAHGAGEVTDLEALSVQELKDRCRAAGLPVSGMKVQLAARLHAHLDHQATGATAGAVA